MSFHICLILSSRSQRVAPIWVPAARSGVPTPGGVRGRRGPDWRQDPLASPLLFHRPFHFTTGFARLDGFPAVMLFLPFG